MEEKLNNIVYVIGVILAILVLIFKNNIPVIIVILAVGLIVGGIFFLINKRTPGYLMIGFGISIGLGVLLYKVNVLDKSDAVTFVFACSIASSMILALVIELVRKSIILKTHTLLVEAELVDLVRNNNVKKEIYLPVYTYKVDDEVYEVNYIRYLDKHLPAIGSTKPLKVNPKNHVDVYFETEIKDKIVYIACAVFLAIVSIVIIVGLFV